MITIETAKQVEINLDEITVTLREEQYGDFLSSIEWVRANEIDALGGFAGRAYIVLRRITHWTGAMMADGSHAPCTMENKLAFAAKYPDYVTRIIDRLNELEDGEQKK